METEIINGIFAVSGAVIGALITGLISWRIAKKNKEKKEVSLYSSYSSQLIEVSDIVKKKAEILIDGKPVNGIYKNEFFVVNTGNATLYELNIGLSLSNEEAQLLNVELNRSNFKIDTEEYQISLNDNRAEIQLSFINPNDEINFILLSDSESQLNIKFRQPEIRSIIKTQYSPETPGVVISAFYDALESNSLVRTYFKLAVPAFRKYLKIKSERNPPHNKV